MHASICEVEVDNMDKGRNRKWVVSLFKGYTVWNCSICLHPQTLGNILLPSLLTFWSIE